MTEASRRLGPWTATLLVVASMIGTGVYTTTGFLVRDVGSSVAVLVAWGVGALAALFGALSYAELTAALPASGGEYALLGRIYRPVLGFLAGWVSFLVGFSAPAAAAALAFGNYLTAILPGISPRTAAVVLVVVLSLVHASPVRISTGFQNTFAIVKLALVTMFAVVGLALVDIGTIVDTGGRQPWDAVTSPGFAVGVIYVFYAYSGWNATAYVAGEIRDPQRVIPISLVLGTGIVACLYLAVNVVFLAAVPAVRLSGVVEVAHVAADELLGPRAGVLVSSLICLGLVSTVGALVIAGPRVYEAVGRDYPRLGFLVRRRGAWGPALAIFLQGIAAIVMVLTASFDTLLAYIGVTLSTFSALTVLGVFVLRRREPDLPRPYRTWGHPVTPAAFVVLMVWVIGYTLYERPATAIVTAATLVAGGLIYAWASRAPLAANR